MCIVISVKLKHAVCLVMLASVAFGTYYGVHKLQQNDSAMSQIEQVWCELLDTRPDENMWHNTWSYDYNNNTFHFTDQTSYEPMSYACCIDKTNPFQVIGCISSILSEVLTYLILGWLLILSVLGCAITCWCRSCKSAEHEAHDMGGELSVV